MKTIEDYDYKLTPINDASPLFDLELLRYVNKGKENQREEFKNEAYGIPLSAALKRIISYRILNGDETISLQEYLKLYKDETSKLENLLK